MHAGVLIFAWMFGVGLLQFLPPRSLAFAVAVLLVLALLLAPVRVQRLVRRVRVLLIAIVVLFAGFTPGEAFFPAWPAWSPSREGVRQALEHAGRLLAVVCCVAILLEKLPTERLIGGLYALSRPLAWAGLSAERVAVRMLLVLRYVDAPGGRGWRDWLADEPATGPEEVLLLRRERFRAWDVVLLAGLIAVSCWMVK
ncbi:hypothetical protein E6C76_00225 [Pseudothauera nasutitermitis]|uniref:Cobalt transport protein n=2 Tax=Pseudothauera nasutitermitis TaxID=2565930 RepID=A0A4S4B4B6_9RHOO|nr:hypothetical protein E6C76_00225 [Pseudothauera nasutitermitis]